MSKGKYDSYRRAPCVTQGQTAVLKAFSGGATSVLSKAGCKQLLSMYFPYCVGGIHGQLWPSPCQGSLWSEPWIHYRTVLPGQSYPLQLWRGHSCAYWPIIQYVHHRTKPLYPLLFQKIWASTIWGHYLSQTISLLTLLRVWTWQLWQSVTVVCWSVCSAHFWEALRRQFFFRHRNWPTHAHFHFLCRTAI